MRNFFKCFDGRCLKMMQHVITYTNGNYVNVNRLACLLFARFYKLNFWRLLTVGGVASLQVWSALIILPKVL